MPGELVDDFIVWECLHRGAQSVLYRVTGRDTGFPLLMKMPRVQSGDAAENLLSYETEAMILPALSGPHVPRFVAAGDIRRTPYIVLEQVAGSSLESLVPRCPMSADEVARIGAAVADAVHSLHQQDAVHCDLKPDNVILKPDGAAVLIDFGLAWHARFPDLIAEEARSASGSAPYLSPEQLLGVRGDPRSDVFALGAILYELATGELPFGTPMTAGGLRQRLWMDPDPPAVLARTVTPALQEIILRCLEPEPAARYQSAAHVAFDLRNPEQVPLTPRATRAERAGFMKQFGLWWRSRDERRLLQRKPQVLISQSPVIMVAIDTSHPDDERHPALQWTVRQLASLNLEFRMICVSAIRAAPIGETGDPAETSSGLQLVHKVRLRDWIEPLRLPAYRLSLHVLESGDPAATLLEFAESNNVDLIVLGAPAPSDAALAWWRSVASSITANARCSVHVVRVPSRPREDWQPAGIDNSER